MLTVIGSIEYFYHSAKQFNIDKQNKEPRLATTLDQLIKLVEGCDLRIRLKNILLLIIVWLEVL
jgi:hypothetical protein